MPIESQLGTKDETTYGTAVTVDRFVPFMSENIQPETFRTRTPALRANKRTHRTDEYVPGILGYAGSIEIPVQSKGFGLWLKRALGAVSTTGPTGGAYAHVGTIDPDECPQSFTMQVNRPFAPCASSDQAFTWEGCQINSWELACSVDDILKFTAEIVAEDGTTGTALASASYPTSVEPLSWAGASVTIEGTSVPVSSFTLSCNNQLKTDRHHLRANTRRSKAPRDDFPEITVSFDADFENLTQYNRFVAETAASSRATVVFTCNAPTAITTGTFPSVVITLEEVDITNAAVNVGGTEMLTQSIEGMVLDDGSNEPIRVSYTSADATP